MLKQKNPTMQMSLNIKPLESSGLSNNKIIKKIIIKFLVQKKKKNKKT